MAANERPQPATFISSLTEEQPAAVWNRLKPLKQLCDTMEKTKRTLNFKKTVVHCSISQKVSLCCGWISWQWDRPNTRWRRLTNPFSKSMVKWPYLPQFEHERFTWTEFKNTFSLGYNRRTFCSYSLLWLYNLLYQSIALGHIGVAHLLQQRRDEILGGWNSFLSALL